MQVYTYSEARQKLALVLEQAKNTGKVLIRRKDGLTFALVPERNIFSPLDVPSIKAKVTTEEIVDIVREGRERENRDSAHFLKGLPDSRLRGNDKSG
jgi:antitoxin Phd